jgi:pyruvate formate lyase activating enzyme
MLKVHSVESFGTQDGPGIRFVVFLQWCVFKCIYCENADTIPAEWGNEMEVEELVEMIKNDRPYFGEEWWCTVSGWEPTFQASWLIPLFQRLHEEWITTCLDTNWRIWNDDVKELVEYTDIFLLDIKHINSEWHKKITGQDNAPVLRFLDYLESKWKRVRLRHVLVPWYSDQMEYIEEMGQKLHWYKCVERMEILPYHRLGEYKWKALWWKYPLEWVEPPKSEIIEKAKKILEKYFDKVTVR